MIKLRVNSRKILSGEKQMLSCKINVFFSSIGLNKRIS